MKLLKELLENTKESTVDIAIGYDDHCSVYRVPVTLFKALKKVKTSGSANNLIVDDGENIAFRRQDPCDKGDLFLDNTSSINNADDFIEQIKEFEKENLTEAQKQKHLLKHHEIP